MLKLQKVRSLFESMGGNYNRFARELDVATSDIYRYLETGIDIAGIKQAVMRYCEENGLKKEDYLEEMS